MKILYNIFTILIFFWSFSGNSQGCSSLDIPTTTGDSVCGLGNLSLSATSSGTGDDIYWYNAATGGLPITHQSTYTTPKLTTTTSYWVSEVLFNGQNSLPGFGRVAPTGHLGFGTNTVHGLQFDVNVGFTLKSVDIYPRSTGQLVISLLDAADNVLDTFTTPIVTNSGSAPITLNLNFDIPRGKGYKLVNTSKHLLTREANIQDFPFNLGANGYLGQITNGLDGLIAKNTYFHFYNWTLGENIVSCESPRKEVIASITQDGDIVVPSIPYIDVQNSTSSYSNTYSGAPGTACGTTDGYLNGNDVIYTYTATTSNSIDIVLQDIDGYYAGMFIYENCSDIGTNCVAGAVNGSNENNIEITGFTTVAGQKYFIVISSWLSTSIDYTLTISDFTCSSFPSPTGDAIQTFGPTDTLSDLVVDVTLPGSTLTWYSDAAGTTSIPDTTPLVDNTLYYVSQTFGTCEGSLLTIKAIAVDCASFTISTVGDTVTCKGKGDLTATSSGLGNNIYWYDAQTGGKRIGTGPSFTTDEKTSTTSFWASEVFIYEPVTITNIGKNAPTQLIHSISLYQHRGLEFDVNSSFVLKSVEVYPEDNGKLEIALFDGLGTLLQSTTYMVTKGSGPVTIPLYFKIEPGLNYRLMEISKLLKDDTQGNTFPYPIGPNGTLGSISRSIQMDVYDGFLRSNFNYYSALFNWTVETGAQMCESPRVEALLTVDSSGDKVISSLNYTDTDNTANYGNNFYGELGCGSGGDYLDGDDVVYSYSPTSDNILTLELKNVSNTEASLFIYKGDCVDIGTNCLAGALNQNGTYKIEDFYVTAGENYYFVVSSKTGSTNYTLEVNEFNCLTDLNAPVGDAVQYFVGAQDLSFLQLEQHIYSSSLNWYSDAAGTVSIPQNTQLVDNTTYYVSQTVIGCESDLLAILVNEFDCTALVVSNTTGNVVCQSGSMVLTAQTNGIGNNVFWYASATGSEPIAYGPTFETPELTTTTSYWAEESFRNGNPSISGQGKVGPNGTNSFAAHNYGLKFDVTKSFTLISVDVYPDDSGLLEISLVNNSGTVLKSKSVNVEKGTGPTGVFLNFEIAPGDGYRLVQTSNPSLKLIHDLSNLSFPYLLGTNGNLGAIVSGAQTGSGSSFYGYFYNWTLATGDIMCTSPRVEAIAEVNTTIPQAPTGDASQEFCDTNPTLADLVVVGNNIKWYDINNVMLAPSEPLVFGVSYFATQTINACESSTLEVKGILLDNSDLPQGDKNQTYFDGQTIADLNVAGDNLIWYDDVDRTNILPTSTLLVNQTTYYVSQHEVGKCESDLLNVTVHLILGVNDAAFSNLKIYPNPATHEVNINNNLPIDSLEIYNLVGQRVHTQNSGLERAATIDVSNLSSGTYFINIIISGQSKVYKLIKK